jgi:hypothetical protein
MSAVLDFAIEMIKTPTVLVLGAGASKHYDFPTGPELFRELIERTWRVPGNPAGGVYELSRPAARLNQDCGVDAGELTDFCDCLQRSGVGSIDQFLERRPDLAEIGKQMIASALIPYESIAELYQPPKIARSWYHHVFQQLGPPDNFKSNRLTIVTFNYDRSWEAFVTTSLQNAYKLPPSEALRLGASIRVIHPHGLLGRYVVDDAQAGRTFDGKVNPRSVDVAAKAIKVVSEADGAMEEFSHAREAIAEAERVIFIGFSYHADTIKRIRVDRMDRKSISGTIFALSDHEVRDAEGLLGGAKLVTTSSDHDAYAFLRNQRALNR